MFSASAASVSGDGKATLTTALSISNTGTVTGTNVTAGELDFGTIAIGTVDTKFSIAPSTGALTSDITPANGGAKATGGTPNAAAFFAEGTVGQTYAVVLGAPSATTDLGTTLSNLQATFTNTLAAGANQINVGGDLLVPSNAGTGAVAYSFSVTVNYN